MTPQLMRKYVPVAKSQNLLRLFDYCRNVSSVSISGSELTAPKIFPAVPNEPSSSSHYAQELAIRRLSRSLRFGDIESLLDAHKADDRIKEEPFLSTIIRSYGLAGMFDHALRTYEQMDSFGTPRSALSFNALLAACCESKKFEKVTGLFNEYPKKFNLKPDRVSYEILIKSCCALRDADNAVSAMSEMENKTSGATTAAFCALLKLYYEERRIAKAEALWREMVEKGVELNTEAYNIRIIQSKKQGVGRVLKLISEMKTSGIEPDIISYNQLIICYVRLRKLKDALNVFYGLKKLKCKPNSATFTVLIAFICKVRNYKVAYKFFKSSASYRELPSFLVLQRLIRGLFKKSLVKEAVDLNEQVTKLLENDARKKWVEACKSLQLPKLE